MALTLSGRDLMLTGLQSGTVATPFNTANTHIGVGTSTTAFSNAHTDLLGTPVRKVVDQAVTWTTGQLVARTTFGTSEANFAWNEWGVFNASTGGTMLSRKQEALGTKTSAQTWVITVTLTFATA